MPDRDNAKGRSCLLSLGLSSLFSENNSSLHVHAGEITHPSAAAGMLLMKAVFQKTFPPPRYSRHIRYANLLCL